MQQYHVPHSSSAVSAVYVYSCTENQEAFLPEYYNQWGVVHLEPHINGTAVHEFYIVVHPSREIHVYALHGSMDIARIILLRIIMPGPWAVF